MPPEADPVLRELGELRRQVDSMDGRIHAIHQELVGYGNGQGDGLIKRVRDLEERVESIDKRSWAMEAVRALLATVAGLFGGRYGA